MMARTIPLLARALLLGGLVLALGGESLAQGTITEVTVFEDRARAVRTVAITLDAGSNRIEVPEHPTSRAVP